MEERDGHIVEPSTAARRPPTISRAKAGIAPLSLPNECGRDAYAQKSLMKYWLLSFLSNHDPAAELLTLEMAKGPDQ
jgi:hypothetical protein